jgi:pimeloyl-ACP methyl ester carboxylesterase
LSQRPAKGEGRVTTFALVHGGQHGGWCWEQVEPLLQAAGHATVAPDLPFEDEGAGSREWASVVIDALGSAEAGGDVVLVGHSMGGLALPVVAARRSVRGMVFLGALVPVPGRPIAEVLAEEAPSVVFDASLGDASDSPTGLSWEAARAGFYQDCQEDVARRAFERLRAMSLVAHTEACPLQEWPDVPSVTIVMSDDRAVSPDWSRRVAQGRLGAPVRELPGGHSPFLSRPAELAELLVTIASDLPQVGTSDLESTQDGASR